MFWYFSMSSKLKMTFIGVFRALDNLKIQVKDMSLRPFSIIPICERDTPERKLSSSCVIF